MQAIRTLLFPITTRQLPRLYRPFLPVMCVPVFHQQSLFTIDSRFFARNHNNRGKPNYKPLNKRKSANIDESDSSQMNQIHQMMGFAQAHNHLLPPIRTQEDIARIFEEPDPLALTKTDIRN